MGTKFKSVSISPIDYEQHKMMARSLFKLQLIHTEAFSMLVEGQSAKTEARDFAARRVNRRHRPTKVSP
jgi:hypothetical protein